MEHSQFTIFFTSFLALLTSDKQHRNGETNKLNILMLLRRRWNCWTGHKRTKSQLWTLKDWTLADRGVRLKSVFLTIP